MIKNNHFERAHFMKKISSLLLALAVMGTATADMGLVTVDMNRLLLESAPGQALQKEIQAEAQKVQTQQQEAMQELNTKREALQKQAKALSSSALQQKQVDLAMTERRLQRELTGASEDLQLLAKQKESELRAELSDTVGEIAEEQSWGAVFDRSAPGFMAGAKSAQVDEQLISLINERSEKEVVVAAADQSEAADDVIIG
jgi:Skp family chaperone for outer membrane proteins